MPVKVISGRSKSGKSKYIYDEISRLTSEGKKTVLIVPEQFSHVAEKKLLLSVESIHDSGPEVYSFAHLSTVLEKKLDYRTNSKISSVGKLLLIRDILHGNEFQFYTNAREKIGFADMVSSLISEFKKYNVTPDILKTIISDTKDELLKMKLSDLYIIYEQYSKYIQKNYDDIDDSLTILACKIRESNYFNDKHVFIDEFSTFVPQEMNVICALADCSQELTITLCCDKTEKNTTLFMPTSDTLKKLTTNIGQDISFKQIGDTHFDSGELKHLEKNLFSFPAKKYSQKPENIHVFSFANPLSEVKNCAAFIKKIIREKGYMYRDIGVICSDLDTYYQHISREFSHSEIAYFADKKDDILNHHLIRFVLGVIEIYTDDYSFESIFNYLKSSVIDVNPVHISVLQKLIQKRKIRRSSWLDDKKWKDILKLSFSDDMYHVLDDIRNKYILPLAVMHENIKGKKNIKDTVTVFYNFLTSLDIPQNISAYIEKFNNSGESRLAKEYEKVWKIIITSLDEIINICGDKKVSPSEFYELLVTAFSQYKVGFIPSAADGVLVGNTERTRFDGIKVLFVLGANETVFPVPPKSDGVLGDSDKASINTCGYDFSTTSSIASYYSQFVTYSVFTMPSHELYISYSKTGNDFKTLRKSYIVDRILKIFDIPELSEASLEDIHYIHSVGPLKEELATHLSKFIHGCDVDSIWKSVYNYYRDKDVFVSKLESFINSDNIAKTLSEENLKLLIPLLSHTSISKIERYMACKYAFFIDYILNIDVDVDSPVTSLELGNIVHTVLEKISKEFGYSRKSFEDASDADILEKTEQYINEYIGNLSQAGIELSSREEYCIKRLKNSIYISFLAVKKQILESSFEPLGYEIEFSDSSDMGSIIVETDDNRFVSLSGKIDRADISYTEDGNYVRVIDYKTGSKEFKFDEVLYGLSVQLMVYLNKLVLSNDNCYHGGAWLFPVKDIVVKSNGKMQKQEYDKEISSSLKLKGVVPCDDKVLCLYDERTEAALKHGASKDKRLSLDDFEIADKYLSKKIGLICGEILRGNFEISPCMKNDKTPCEYCEYNSLCRFNPLDGDGEYTRYKSINRYKDIIDEMEAALDVDRESTDGN